MIYVWILSVIIYLVVGLGVTSAFDEETALDTGVAVWFIFLWPLYLLCRASYTIAKKAIRKGVRP